MHIVEGGLADFVSVNSWELLMINPNEEHTLDYGEVIFTLTLVSKL